MPKLSRLVCEGRIKAYNVVLTALQLELDDPKVDEPCETLEEFAYLLRCFKKERVVFAQKHGVEI